MPGAASCGLRRPGCLARSARPGGASAFTRMTTSLRPRTRRHRRALAVIDRPGRQRAAHRRARGPQPGRRPGGWAAAVRRVRRPTRARPHRRPPVGGARRLADVLQVLRQPVPLPLHVHHRDHHAALVGSPASRRRTTSRPSMNNHLGEPADLVLGLQSEATPGAIHGEARAVRARAATTGSPTCPAATASGSAPVGTSRPASCTPPRASAPTSPRPPCDVFVHVRVVVPTTGRSAEELLWKDVPAGPVRATSTSSSSCSTGSGTSTPSSGIAT